MPWRDTGKDAWLPPPRFSHNRKSLSVVFNSAAVNKSLKSDLLICSLSPLTLCLFLLPLTRRAGYELSQGWKTRWKPTRAASLLSPRGFQGSNSGHQVWKKVHLPTKASHQPKNILYRNVNENPETQKHTRAPLAFSIAVGRFLALPVGIANHQ